MQSFIKDFPQFAGRDRFNNCSQCCSKSFCGRLLKFAIFTESISRIDLLSSVVEPGYLPFDIDQAVTIPSDATDRLCEAAQQAGAYVAIGMNERNAEASSGSLYNTLLYIDTDGQILGKHRKMVPTGP